MFAQAPILGSLIEPTGGDLGDYWRLGNIEPLLSKLLAKVRRGEPEMAMDAIAARGMVDAATILSRRYTLQATNVPFLGRGKQTSALSDFIGRVYEEAKADLATAMIARMRKLASECGSIAIVSPQNWYVLDGYRTFRKQLLEEGSLHVVCDLGPAAFRDMNWWAARTALSVFSNVKPESTQLSLSITLKEHKDTDEKEALARAGNFNLIPQREQRDNPDSRIVAERLSSNDYLVRHCRSRQGIKTGDDARYRRNIWEFQNWGELWRKFQSSPDSTAPFGGCSDIV
ncbi:hypothetical protein EN933_22030, partial [Mesorhizobium sp. M7A.F.Ca.US.001.01.1.1]